MISSWILAARLRTLPAAIAPVLLGCALAYGEQKSHLLAAVAAMLGAILIQIGTNFANDYFDFINGADTEERIGPTATQAGLITPANMKWAFLLTFAATVPIIVYLTVRGGQLSGLVYPSHRNLATGGPRPQATGQAMSSLIFSTNRGCWNALCSESAVVYRCNDDRTCIWIDLHGDTGGQQSTRCQHRCNGKKEHLSCALDSNCTPNTLCVCLEQPLFRFAVNRPWIWGSVLALSLAIPPLRSIWRDEGRALDPNLAKTAKVLVAYSVAFSVGWILS